MNSQDTLPAAQASLSIPDTALDIPADTLVGIPAIAAFLRQSRRRAYYLCESGQIPAFRLGCRWHLRKSTYAAHIARLEAAVLKASEAA